MTQTNEAAFETVIEAHLLARGYVPAEEGGFDRERAIFPDTVLGFIRETQPKEWTKLEALHGMNTGEQVLADLCKWMDISGAGREPRPLTTEQRRELEREYREGLPLALELQKELRGDPDFARRARELVESMRNLEVGRFPGDPAELERLRASIVDGLRQVELELSRRLGAGHGELRLPAHEEIPDSYRRQVEQYYRSLAQRPRR